VRQSLIRRLGQADCQRVAVMLVHSDFEPLDESGIHDRPYGLALPWDRHAEAPRLARGLLAQVARETRRTASAGGGLKILLVDDSRTSRVTYQRLLKSHGYVVTACESAEAALEVVKGTERFDLAIVDYYMPGMNGAQLCHALRELPATRDLTLAILTGSYEDGLISDCLAAGASECMFKTESNELFLARVHSMATLRERELRLEGERMRLELILGSVGDGVYGVDREGRITFVNPAALRLLQWNDAEGVVGTLAHQKIHFADERGKPIPPDTCFLQQAYELGDSLSNWETVFWRADGHAFSVECTVRPQYRDGECVGAVVAFRDIAERKRFEAELQWQLHHDHLTKLYNRAYFENALEQELLRLKRSAERSALLFIDLDRFKHVNDTAGHAAGDALLTSIGQKLKSRSRQSDLVARLSGDEFAVLLRNVDEAHITSLAEQFRAILDESTFVYEGRSFEVSGSVGITRLNRHTLTPAHAMNCADAACQIAKRQGRNRIHMFDANEDADVLASLEQSWSERLRRALAAGNFSLQFQPILDLTRPVLYGYEVFLRLADAATPLAPCAFLPQAERFELMPALDTWVLDSLATLMSHRRPPHGARLHVNVAISSLMDPGYRARLASLLRRGVFAQGQLCLELKEEDGPNRLGTLLPELRELTRLGLTLVLDGYGRGFVSLDDLRRLPLGAVKFDGDIVQSLQGDELGEPLLKAMTELAHALNVVVIAPLVEDADTLRRLRTAGVDCAQGFALGSPAELWREHDTLPGTLTPENGIAA
jgi:diguanylate cyclase (GGDEF)-like protein/PAS domain S-box-containing protein